MIRHIVLFTFSTNTQPGDIETIEKGFRNLQQQIDGIINFEWGVNNSPEGLHHDLTHGFVLTFASIAHRDAYLPHPAHQAFVSLLKPHVENALVFDYEPLP